MTSIILKQTFQIAQKIRLSTKKALFLCLFFSWAHFGLQAQKSIADSSISLHVISAQVKAQLPGAELADRFGWSSAIGMQYTYKSKGQWLIGAEASFIFGTKVKEDSMLNFLLNSDQTLIDFNGFAGDIILDQRAFDLQFSLSRYFLKAGPNENSGFYAGLGVGYLQHKIRVRELADKLPLLEGDYVKGYDRLTGGLFITERIGYRYFANNKRVNFFAELEFGQGFTQGLRSYQYDLRRPFKDRHFDLLNSLKAGWSFAIYKRSGDKFFYD